jgi:hypothetical protein
MCHGVATDFYKFRVEKTGVLEGFKHKIEIREWTY